MKQDDFVHFFRLGVGAGLFLTLRLVERRITPLSGEIPRYESLRFSNVNFVFESIISSIEHATITEGRGPFFFTAEL